MEVIGQKETRPTLAETSVLTESGIRFFATYRLWIVAVVWLSTRTYAIWGLTPNFYVDGYLQIAGDWLDGFTPYASFKVEYPPGALLLFALPRLLAETPLAYGYIFAAVMLLADLGILLLLWRMPATISGSDIKNVELRRYKCSVICVTYLLFTAIFRSLLFQHYELIIALLLSAVIYLSLRKKNAVVDVLLAAGVWLKLGVLFCVPLIWWYGFSSHDGPSGSNRSDKIVQFMRSLLPRIALFIATLVVFFLPFILSSGRSLDYIVQYHFERGLQVESLAANILMLIAKLYDFELATEFAHRAMHWSGWMSSPGANVCGILQVVVFVIVTIYAAYKMIRQPEAAARDGFLIQGLVATFLALLLTSKAFMPQYLLWIAPLAALLAHDENPRIRQAGWHLFTVNLLSVILFFFFYPDLVKVDFIPVILLLIRNLFVVWLITNFLLSNKFTADQQVPTQHTAPRFRRYLIYVPILLLFVWGTIAAFSPLSTNDLWLLLREASDIIESGEIPRIEQYSAVAAGRPYLAHEWLGGLIFLGIFKLGGGEALTVFRALIMLAMLLFLWFSLEKRDRNFFLAAPLLALTAYMILERMFVRPHIFTLLFLCIWVFAMEHWRRQRKMRYLIMLVPLQVLWANVHGGYIFSLVFGAMMTGGTAFLVLFPNWSKTESYTWPDVFKLAMLTLACLAASLINPHGARLVEFSLTMGLASDYISQFVFEWGSPLGDQYARSYGRQVAQATFFLMWLGLSLSIKRRPLLDAIVALLATAMAVQAIRFVSFIGILGFPLMVRAWQSVATISLKSPLYKRRPWIETVLFGLLLSSSIVYGFPYEKTHHRSLGWGFGGRMPYEATRFLVQQGFEGIIFNDYGDGAFLIYHLYPKIRPVMDSRIDVYGRELSHEYFSSRDDPIKFFQYLNKYNVSLILLRKSKGNEQVLNFLARLPATKVLLATDSRLLFSYDPKLLPPEFKQRLTP